MRRLLGMLWPLVVGGVFLWDNVRSADATTLVSLVPLLEGRQITGVGLFENGDPKTINLHISIKGVRPWLIPSPTTITADANRIFVSNGNSAQSKRESIGRSSH